MTAVRCHLNNFDFVRITAALLVLFHHQFDLMSQKAYQIFPVGYGEIGVYIFFTVSGFLVTQSWNNDPHVLRFMARRFLRIWPGLAAVTCLAALLIGPIITAVSLSDYFHSKLTVHFFRTLQLDIQYFLPGVFATNPYPNAVNGSLWTIPLEVKWYGILLIGGCLRLLKFKWIIFIFMVSLAVYQFGIYHSETNQIPNYNRQFGLFFVYGSCLCLFKNLWQKRLVHGLIVIGLLGSGFWIANHHIMAVWIVLPFLVIAFGTLCLPVFNRFGRFGDLSYGVYIYAFPVQQLIIWMNQGKLSLLVCLIFTIVCTLTLAFISWHCIEKPALKFKPKTPAEPTRVQILAANRQGDIPAIR